MHHRLTHTNAQPRLAHMAFALSTPFLRTAALAVLFYPFPPLQQMLLLLFLVFPLAGALIISAPDSCGGTHTITHATALFGPKPAASSVRDVPIFAPRAQLDGAYIRVSSPPPRINTTRRRRQRSRARFVMGILFGDTHPAPLSHVEEHPHVSSQHLDTPYHHVSDENSDTRKFEDVRHSERSEQLVQDDPEAHDAGPIEEPQHPPDPPITFETDTTSRAISASQQRRQDQIRPSSTSSEPPAFSLFNACDRLSVPSDVLDVKGRVAVVARGVCDFAQKVGNMQDAGAVAVIVVNSKEEGENLANMKLNETKDNPEITIPAVMIRYDDWVIIAPCRNGTTVVFTAEGEATFDIDYGRDALNWAMMRGMALWILCQCGVNVVRYKRRVSEFRARADAIAALPVETYQRPSGRDTQPQRADESQETGELPEPIPNETISETTESTSISKQESEKSPLLRPDMDSAAQASSSSAQAGSSSYNSPKNEEATEGEDDTEEEEQVCAVCLEEFETGQHVRSLACSHLYHKSCIDPWLQSSSNCCPLCKREVPNLPPPPTQMHYGSMVV